MAKLTLQAVVVGCADGRLYFLGVASGQQQAVVDTAGAIKSLPVVDSWQGWGCLWMASHGKQLQACSSQGETFLQCLKSVFWKPILIGMFMTKQLW